MTKIFLMKLTKIQPSQLYISSEKLSELTKNLDSAELDSFDPIPVKRLGDQLIFTDGHTRALAAFLQGFSKVRVVWEVDELDWEAYEICVKWCKDEGICTIADLDRVVSQADYEALWLRRCKKMHRDLAQEEDSYRHHM